MTSEKYLKYQTPKAPADVNQEFMTVQETAYVLGCAVKTIRQRIASLGLKAGAGRRIITSRADRLAIHEASRITTLSPTARARSRSATRRSGERSGRATAKEEGRLRHYTPDEAAALIPLSARKLRELAYLRKIPHSNLGGRFSFTLADLRGVAVMYHFEPFAAG
ncbi:helix-turn-helix domain-containing protein [Streptomyces sp. SPB074]|uniref:helix-turn-helix domain-containing protein n=1 Tax=Streptomyces sp. (strain SPB074) TaxID=465543 RepID=UPI00017F1014|nr:helix-turn-helix domain-containing protein [Streptomyces sp. SPB074]EDY42510.1 hypothetical protein SSBG_00472 [Streptomyces sp. SPB074]